MFTYQDIMNRLTDKEQQNAINAYALELDKKIWSYSTKSQKEFTLKTLCVDVFKSYSDLIDKLDRSTIEEGHPYIIYSKDDDCFYSGVSPLAMYQALYPEDIEDFVIWYKEEGLLEEVYIVRAEADDMNFIMKDNGNEAPTYINYYFGEKDDNITREYYADYIKEHYGKEL